LNLKIKNKKVKIFFLNDRRISLQACYTTHLLHAFLFHGYQLQKEAKNKLQLEINLQSQIQIQPNVIMMKFTYK